MDATAWIAIGNGCVSLCQFLSCPTAFLTPFLFLQFHLSCVGLQAIPKGRWFCDECRVRCLFPLLSTCSRLILALFSRRRRPTNRRRGGNWLVQLASKKEEDGRFAIGLQLCTPEHPVRSVCISRLRACGSWMVRRTDKSGDSQRLHPTHLSTDFSVSPLSFHVLPFWPCSRSPPNLLFFRHVIDQPRVSEH